MIKKKTTILGIDLPLFMFLFSLATSLITFYVHTEVSLTKLDVELTALRADYLRHTDANAAEFSEIKTSFDSRDKEIITKIDNIQSFLLNHSKQNR